MSLAVRATAQSVVFYGVVGALLFGPAGTFRFYEAWVLLGVVAAASLLITAYLFAFDRALLERRLAVGDRGEIEPVQKRIQAFMGLSFVAMLVVCGLDRRFGWSHVSLPVALAANVVVALAFVIVFFVFRANSFTSSIVEVSAQQKVVTTGPYAIVRHPMYSGALILLVATPIALGSLVGEAVIPVFYVGVVLRLLHEESFLKRELAGYEDYMRTTRFRLVPFVW